MRVGGAQTMLIDIMNEQCKDNDVHLFIINNDYTDCLINEINENVCVHKLGRPIGSLNPYYIIKLNILLFRLSPDVIHIHNSSIIKLVFLKNAPKILTVHDTGLDVSLLNLYNKIVAISKSVCHDIEMRSGIKCCIIENGIVVNNIKHINYKWVNNKSKTYRIVQVSRLMLPKKGQDILIKAMSILIRKGYNIELSLIGIGESETEIKRVIKSENLEKQVHFLGLKNRNYIYDHLCEYDLFVQPSRNEGFGLTVAEAIASGIPVLVSNIEGPMEIIKNGIYGVFFKSGNVQDCAEKIEYIINNKYNVDSIANRSHIYKSYDIKVTVDKYIKLYKMLINDDK